MNRKAGLSLLGIRQPDGTRGLITEVGKRFRVRVDNELDVPLSSIGMASTPPGSRMAFLASPGRRSRQAPAPNTTFRCASAARSGCIRTRACKNNYSSRPRLSFATGATRRGSRKWWSHSPSFSFTPPEEIYERLRKRSRVVGVPPATSGTDSSPAKTRSEKRMMAGMAKGGASAGPDLNDVKYDAFLANDRTLTDPETIRVEPGETILLRVINSSAMSAYHIDLGALRGTLIAVDGFRVHPVAGRRFPIAVAQRLDIRIAIPSTPASHPVLAILEGERRQTGVILVAGNAPVTRISEIARCHRPRSPSI